MPSPRYVRPILFQEPLYTPTLPASLRPTYKGAGNDCGCGSPIATNVQPHGLLIAGARRLSGLSGGFGTFADGIEPTPMHYVYGVASIAGTAAGAYHGFKRNGGSVGWAIVWGLLGGMFPVITVPIAFAQGFGKRAGR